MTDSLTISCTTLGSQLSLSLADGGRLVTCTIIADNHKKITSKANPLKLGPVIDRLEAAKASYTLWQDPGKYKPLLWCWWHSGSLLLAIPGSPATYSNYIAVTTDNLTELVGFLKRAYKNAQRQPVSGQTATPVFGL